MTDATQRPVAGVLPFLRVANLDTLTVAEPADLCMAADRGRDTSRAHYLSE